MKASKVASVVAALIASDAKPTEAQILAAILAADKKGKDEGGLGPVEIEKKDKAKDADMDDDKAKDADMDDDKAKDADMDDMDAEDEDKDEDKAKDEDVQPKKSASGNSGAGGAEPAKDTAAIVAAALAARDALHDARRAVEPILGVVAYDSAADVYKAALVKLNVAVDGIDPSAFPALYKMAVEAREAATPRMASDSAVVKTMTTVIKGYDRLR